MFELSVVVRDKAGNPVTHANGVPRRKLISASTGLQLWEEYNKVAPSGPRKRKRRKKLKVQSKPTSEKIKKSRKKFDDETTTKDR